eukprot:6204059-Pleurochrysis_carterae.AAC.3
MSREVEWVNACEEAGGRARRREGQCKEASSAQCEASSISHARHKARNCIQMKRWPRHSQHERKATRE